MYMPCSSVPGTLAVALAHQFPRAAAVARPRSPPTAILATSRLPSRTQSRPLSTTSILRSQSTSNSIRHFTYNVAASYIAKDRPYDPATHVFHFNPYNRVQPPLKRSKRARPESGQDAFFVTRLNDTGGVALGVADGVGGWMDSGVDPADFSHGFCDYMAAAAYATTTSKQPPLSARALMQTGYEAICADPSVPAGGSTAIVGLLDPSGSLDVANLGDSGYIHLRLGAVHGHSEPQVHAFNTPFQLSTIPPAILRRMQAFGGDRLADLPRDAEVSRLGLRHGDVLVFATDGVWDNLFNQDILRIVSAAMARGGAWVVGGDAGGIAVRPDLSECTEVSAAEGGSGGRTIGTLQSAIATDITAAAKAASVNTKLDGPFAKEVKKYYPSENWRGGKVDDICVLAVVVSEKKPDEAPIKSKL